MTCASCNKPIIVAVIMVHEGSEWSLCKECWKPTPKAVAAIRTKGKKR